MQVPQTAFPGGLEDMSESYSSCKSFLDFPNWVPEDVDDPRWNLEG
jgi:hypothetical protein